VIFDRCPDFTCRTWGFFSSILHRNMEDRFDILEAQHVTSIGKYKYPSHFLSFSTNSPFFLLFTKIQPRAPHGPFSALGVSKNMVGISMISCLRASLSSWTYISHSIPCLLHQHRFVYCATCLCSHCLFPSRSSRHLLKRTCAVIVDISETCPICIYILTDISNSRRRQKHRQFSQFFW